MPSTASSRRHPADAAITELDAASRFVTACERAHLQRVLIIGGAPDLRAALLAILVKLDVRAIDGAAALTDDRADRLADWADVVVLWGAGLHQTVTEHFESGRKRSIVVSVGASGIAALLDATAGRLLSADRT